MKCKLEGNQSKKQRKKTDLSSLKGKLEEDQSKKAKKKDRFNRSVL